MGKGMEIVVEFERRMEGCSGEAASFQKREPSLADSPWRADSSTIVSWRHLVAQPVGFWGATKLYFMDKPSQSLGHEVLTML